MTTLSFEDVPVKPAIINGMSSNTQDDAPDINGMPEYSCETCGKELNYSGRGRKPKFCDEHKRSSTSRTSTSSTSNEKLASAALEVLVQGNNICAMGLMLMQMPKTASAIAAREDPFRLQVFEALKADPTLAKSILKAGATSGKAMLLVAYGMLAASIIPVAYGEIKEKKSAESENEDNN